MYEASGADAVFLLPSYSISPYSTPASQVAQYDSGYGKKYPKIMADTPWNQWRDGKRHAERKKKQHMTINSFCWRSVMNNSCPIVCCSFCLPTGSVHFLAGLITWDRPCVPRQERHCAHRGETLRAFWNRGTRLVTNLPFRPRDFSGFAAVRVRVPSGIGAFENIPKLLMGRTLRRSKFS